MKDVLGEQDAGECLLLEGVSFSEAAQQTTVGSVGRSGGFTWPGRIALGLAVAALFVFFARNPSDEVPAIAAPTPASVDEQPVVDPERPASEPGPEPLLGIASGERAPWPVLADDHAPHIIGRPGLGEPVRDDLANMTVVYVNDLGRPTVIDLSTGDQRELDISLLRARDDFLVEFGRVVVPADSNLDRPKSQGRAFEFTVERTRAQAGVPVSDGQLARVNGLPLREPTGPTLCLDVGGCSGAALLTGTFGGELDWLRSMETADNPTAVLAQILGSSQWSPTDRWTVYVLGNDVLPDQDGQIELRLPTPLSTTVVWVIEQTDSGNEVEAGQEVELPSSPWTAGIVR